MSAKHKTPALVGESVTTSTDSNNQSCSKIQSTALGPVHDGLVIHRSTDEFIAGWAAASINTSVLFPVNKLIFRQMAGGHKVMFAADQMYEEGFRYLYRGILPPLIQKTLSVSLMYGSFGLYKEWTNRNFSNSPYVVNLTLTAFMTGTTEAILTPLERVQMLLQDRSYHKNFRNAQDAWLKLRKFGMKEYYRGLTCVLARNGPSNILFFGLKDEIKQLLSGFRSTQTRPIQSPSNNFQDPGFLPEDKTSEPIRHKNLMLHDFLSGAILGMFISTLFYPLSVIRTRMQTRAPGTEFLSIVKAFNEVYKERDRKFSRLFHGCLINVLRQFVSWGIINCSYEYFLAMVRKEV